MGFQPAESSPPLCGYSWKEKGKLEVSNLKHFLSFPQIWKQASKNISLPFAKRNLKQKLRLIKFIIPLKKEVGLSKKWWKLKQRERQNRHLQLLPCSKQLLLGLVFLPSAL